MNLVKDKVKSKEIAEMYYGKLKMQFKELCAIKKLDESEVKKQWIKDFVIKNKSKCSEKYYLKYHGNKEEVLIFGDNGKFYELSNGSLIDKMTFEKMFRTEFTDLQVNPDDFFTTAAFQINEKIIKPIDIKKYDKNEMEFSKKIKDIFDDIDIKNVTFEKQKPTINIITPIWNNELINKKSK